MTRGGTTVRLGYLGEGLGRRKGGGLDNRGVAPTHVGNRRKNLLIRDMRGGWRGGAKGGGSPARICRSQSLFLSTSGGYRGREREI